MTNKEAELINATNHSVSGISLYAKTNEEGHHCMSGNIIEVRTLDLNQEFEIIAAQLNQIADTFKTNWNVL